MQTPEKTTKKSNKKPSIKTRHMMYTQQLDHLPLQTMDNVIDRVQTLNPDRYAAIIHDKDEGEAPHLHLMLSFKNPRSVNEIAKQLNDKPQYVEAWNSKDGNGYAYLVHATRNAVAKHQYNPKEVIANFNYSAELEKISEKVEKARSKAAVGTLLDAVYAGALTKEQAEAQLSGAQYARIKRQLDDVSAKRLEQQATIWRKEMIEQGKPITCIWIFGSSGVGKTSLAKEHAERENRPYFITGSSRDPFQRYNGEHTIILDELRSNVIPYHDLLRILDPFGEQVNAPSRYYDKALAADLFIITSPFDPYEFYHGYHTINPMPFASCPDTDSFEQLERRISLTLMMNEQSIIPMEYDFMSWRYDPIPNISRKNPYSTKNRPPQSAIDPMELFYSMFED